MLTAKEGVMFIRRVAISGALILLAACGGGGGGGTGGGSGSGTQATGLVPTAPVLGATLYADASVLRVVRSGAVWTYRGVDRPDASGNQFSVYENRVSHAAASVGVNESSTNAFNTGTDVTPVRVDGGSVLQRVDLTELGVTGGPIDAIELRSPVRVNDQYTIFDRTISGAVADLDGDKQAEALDLAMWWRVIGEETMDLLQRPGVRAVQVETVVLARARLSSNGQLTETVRLTNKVWYAKGIGIVKQESDIPNANVPTLRNVTTETLVSWDGLNEGLGALPVINVVGPSGSSVAGQSLGAAIDGASFGDHAVVRFSNGPIVNLALARVDSSGQVTQAVVHGPDTIDGALVIPRQMFAAGGGVRVVSWSARGLVLTAYDSTNLQRIAGQPVVLAGVPGAATGDGFDVAVGGVGDRIWMVWPRDTGTYVDGRPAADVIARGFDAWGTPIGPEITLRSQVDPTALSNMSVAVNVDRAVVSWAEGFNRPLQYRVFGNSDSALLATQELPVDAVYARGWATSSRLGFVQSVGSGSGSAWLLDSTFSAINGLGGFLSGEVVAPAAWRPFTLVGLPAASGSDLYFAGTAFGRTWSEDILDSTTVVMFAVTPSDGPLSTTAAVKPLMRVPLDSTNFVPSFALPLVDKVLMVGTTSGQRLAIQPTWR